MFEDDLNRWSKKSFEDIKDLFNRASRNKRFAPASLKDDEITIDNKDKPNRDKPIQDDDIRNLMIALNTSEGLDDFLRSV
jgi:hypothetical protein